MKTFRLILLGLFCSTVNHASSHFNDISLLENSLVEQDSEMLELDRVIKNSPQEPSLGASLASAEFKDDIVLKFTVNNSLSEELNAGLDAIMETKWTLRDKIILGVNMAIWGGTYYFLQKGISKSWENDFLGTCSENDLSCFIWQYVQSKSMQIKNNILEYGVTPNVCIAWSFYVISRLMECSERYLPYPKALSAFHQELPLGLKIKSGFMEATALVMGGVLGGIPAFSFYNAYRLGNWTTREILPYMIPLAGFLMVETIITFKILKDQLIHNALLKTGEKGLKNAIIEKLEETKHALFHQAEEDLLQTHQTIKTLPTGFDKLKFLLNLTPPERAHEKNNIRFYTQIAAGVLACGATAYIAYLNASGSMASLYDSVADGFNFLGGISPVNQMTLLYFNTYAPNPQNATDAEVLSWFNNCLNNAFTNMAFNPGCNLTVTDIDNITDMGNTTGSGSLPVWCTAWAFFGETCAGVIPTPKEFNIPADIIRSADNARSWLVFLFQTFQTAAGTTSTDPVPASDAAVRFGNGMGGISAAFTTALTTLQTFKVVDGLFDLFSKHPNNAEAGRKSKVFNGVNLAFSTLEAAFRTLPVAMMNYFAMDGIVPDSIFWPLLVANCLVTMCTFINYFFDHYQKLPAALQASWGIYLMAKEKVWGTPYESPKAFYQKYDGLQKKVDDLITHVAKMKDTDLKALANTLDIQEKNEEEESSVVSALQTVRVVAEGM